MTNTAAQIAVLVKGDEGASGARQNCGLRIADCGLDCGLLYVLSDRSSRELQQKAAIALARHAKFPRAAAR